VATGAEPDQSRDGLFTHDKPIDSDLKQEKIIPVGSFPRNGSKGPIAFSSYATTVRRALCRQSGDGEEDGEGREQVEFPIRLGLKNLGKRFCA
jgi:hypothetical protein